MRLYKTDKSVLSFEKKPELLLNGITSNTLDKPQNAFLNVHGKIVVVFDQVRIGPDEFWIAVESPFVDALMAHIDKYVRLSGTSLKRLEKSVYFDLDGDGPLQKGQIGIPQKKGRLIISDTPLQTVVSDDEFKLFRLNHRIPLQGVDFTDEFVLNVGGDLVSFTKGCFLGQEPVSKVHNRSRPTWQLVVKYEHDCEAQESAKMTSKTVDPKTQKNFGFIFIRNV